MQKNRDQFMAEVETWSSVEAWIQATNMIGWLRGPREIPPTVVAEPNVTTAQASAAAAAAGDGSRK